MLQFSIIIPTYNRQDLLAKCLASIASQTRDDYEIIIVDDGSTDGTRDYVLQLGGKITLLEQPNRGPGAARNLGIKHATSEYIAFLDSDDCWFPWTLQTYANTIEANQRPAFVAGKPALFTNPGELPTAPDSANSHLIFKDYLASGDEWRWWGVSSFVVKREALLQSGCFSEMNTNGEDADLALKLGTAPGFVQITGPSTFGYFQHEANVTKDLAKTLAGAWHKVRSEKAGSYPGGPERARERLTILTRHLRPVTLACLSADLAGDGWKLYSAAFRWHLSLGKWKFLLGFPAQAMLTKLKRGQR